MAARMQGGEISPAVDIEGPAGQRPGDIGIGIAEGVRRPDTAIALPKLRVDCCDPVLERGDPEIPLLLFPRRKHRPPVRKQLVERKPRIRPSRLPDRLERRFHLVVLFLGDGVVLVRPLRESFRCRPLAIRGPHAF